MSRMAARGLACMLVAMGMLRGSARADGMDVALSHLRIPGGDPRCDRPVGAWCADAELFERLMSEVAMASAPPVLEPAHTLGSRGFYLGMSGAVTTLDADSTHWVRGSEGDAGGADPLTNASPSSALSWTRVHARKGLPFGVELGASAGAGLETSLWAVGGSAKVAVLEGLRSRPRYLPDVAVRVGYERVFGSHQFDLDVVVADLLVSRPFLVSDQWWVTPLAAVQVLWVEVDGGLVDLTPEGPLGCRVDCGVSAADAHNTVRFPSMAQRRYRLVAGAEARYSWLVLAASLSHDPAPPKLDAEMRVFGGARVEAQLSAQLSAGVRF